MNEILQDFSPQALTHAIEANLFAFFSLFGSWPQAEVRSERNMLTSITDIPFPLFNNVLRAQITPTDVDSTIQRTMARYQARNVPILWWTGPSTQPADLGTHLEKFGFISAGSMPGMAIILAELQANPSQASGLRIEAVTDNDTLALWSKLCATGFELPEFVGDVFYDFMLHSATDNLLPYLAWLDGKAVATSLVYMAAGVAGIYNVATLPETRRQGIGAAVTLAPLQAARARGYQAGILHSSSLGAGVYQSLGFREYCKIGQYVWMPQAGA